MKHSIINLDARYTVSLEHTGLSVPMYVARFCDKWIVACITKAEAIMWANTHAENRQRILEGA